MGAFMGGVLAAGAALGRFGIQQVFRAAARPIAPPSVQQRRDAA
jgi:hypothetical protein